MIQGAEICVIKLCFVGLYSDVWCWMVLYGFEIWFVVLSWQLWTIN